MRHNHHAIFPPHANGRDPHRLDRLERVLCDRMGNEEREGETLHINREEEKKGEKKKCDDDADGQSYESKFFLFFFSHA